VLTSLGVAYEVDPRLVRGLDYYTATIFEFKVTAGDLGAQNTVCGGGRYDRLVESLGGPKMPALGFGLGIERALLAMSEPASAFEPSLGVFVAPMDPPALAYALPIVHRLRAAGIRVEVEHRGGTLKSQLKRADKLRARLAIIVGGNEVASRRLQVKDLAAGTQLEIAEADLEAKIHQLLD
jgi:histidyl-tRNA synthetase